MTDYRQIKADLYVPPSEEEGAAGATTSSELCQELQVAWRGLVSPYFLLLLRQREKGVGF